MEKFVTLTSIAAPLIRANVDTDAIIPSREMKRVSKKGLEDGLFAGWRYLTAGGRDENPDFVLNKPQYRDAKIILSGPNFGCGSSREHAVWALVGYGIRAIIAPSFSGIFYNNCIRNGVLPIVLEENVIDCLNATKNGDPTANMLTIDLVKQTVSAMDGQVYEFDIESAHREVLLEGLDPITMTLKLEGEIDAFEAKDREKRPWAYL